MVCGDATDGAVWQALMMDELADACWTDPPYNVGYQSPAGVKIENDSLGDAAFWDFISAFTIQTVAHMKAGAAIYMAHSDAEGFNFRRAFREAGLKLSGCLIWRKNQLIMGRSDYQWIHEPILYGWKPGAAHKFFGGRKQTTLVDRGEGGAIHRGDNDTWLVESGDAVLVIKGDATVEERAASIMFHEKPQRSPEHPTMKPVALIERQLAASTVAGDTVIDGCGGSGSTLIAAERLGLKARLVELEPRYVDVIVRRWQAFTGKAAVHAKTERPFKEI